MGFVNLMCFKTQWNIFRMALSKAENNITFPLFSATPKSVRSESNESGFGATP
jgi:hypothetical protein